MIAGSLAEALVALSLSASLMASLMTTVTVAAALGTEAARAQARLARLRSVEHLLDDALSHPTFANGRSGPIAVAEPDRIVLEADRDGDGRLEAGSGERTSFEIGPGRGDDARLLHRLGRQAMAICDVRRDARIEYFDAFGAPPVSADEVRLVRLPTSEGALFAALPPPWR